MKHMQHSSACPVANLFTNLSVKGPGLSGNFSCLPVNVLPHSSSSLRSMQLRAQGPTTEPQEVHKYKGHSCNSLQKWTGSITAAMSGSWQLPTGRTCLTRHSCAPGGLT